MPTAQELGFKGAALSLLSNRRPCDRPSLIRFCLIATAELPQCTDGVQRFCSTLLLGSVPKALSSVPRSNMSLVRCRDASKNDSFANGDLGQRSFLGLCFFRL